MHICHPAVVDAIAPPAITTDNLEIFRRIELHSLRWRLMNKPRWRWLTDLRFTRREDGEGEPAVSWSGNQDAAALIANDHLK